MNLATKYKKRFNDRPDGRRIRSLQPFNYIVPYIMKTRCSAANQIKVSVDITELEKYILEKRNAGLKGLGVLHVVLTAFVKTAAQMPGINRFISGQKIYARYDIQAMMAIKKEMKLNADETVIKIHYDPSDDLETVFKKFNSTLLDARKDEDNNVEGTAKILNYIPGIFLKFAIWFLNLLDYFGLLPKKLLEISPFHGSFFITSMGSLGIPAIFHHLYDFGNIPIFCCYGAKYKATVTKRDGEMQKKRFIDFTFVLDERICDGHYYATALKQLLEYLKHPEKLDEPVEVIEDVY